MTCGVIADAGQAMEPGDHLVDMSGAPSMNAAMSPYGPTEGYQEEGIYGSHEYAERTGGRHWGPEEIEWLIHLGELFSPHGRELPV